MSETAPSRRILNDELYSRQVPGQPGIKVRERRLRSAPDLLVVPEEDLARVLGPWLDAIDATIMPQSPNMSGVRRPPLTAAVRLSIWTGIDANEIRRIAKGERQFIGLSKADTLLQEIDQPDRLYDGSLRILPNPQMSRETFLRRMKEAGIDDPSDICVE